MSTKAKPEHGKKQSGEIVYVDPVELVVPSVAHEERLEDGTIVLRLNDPHPKAD